MIFSYYPGCTLKNKAQDLDRYARASAEKLGVTLQELENWQCCGGAFSMGKDEIASKLASVRALNAAKEQGQDLVTLCSACHNVLKQANDAMANDAEFSDHANNYMQLDQPYRGETKVIHYLELLRDVVGFENVKKAVVNPLKGRKIAAYYGCLLLRPGKVMQMDNPENPRIMEDFIRAIGMSGAGKSTLLRFGRSSYTADLLQRNENAARDNQTALMNNFSDALMQIDADQAASAEQFAGTMWKSQQDAALAAQKFNAQMRQESNLAQWKQDNADWAAAQKASASGSSGGRRRASGRRTEQETKAGGVQSLIRAGVQAVKGMRKR